MGNPVTVLKKGENLVTKFVSNVVEAKFTTHWQYNMYYFYHIGVAYDLEGASICDIIDSKKDNIPYGNCRKVHHVLGNIKRKIFSSKIF